MVQVLLFLLTKLIIQSVNAKFNNLFPVIDNLASQGLYFGAICLLETWTTTDSDLSLLQLPGYHLIHQGSKCTKHGGLMIYLNDNYSYKIRNLFTKSNIWEGLFIDISGGNLCRTFTIGNIYRPPHDNNANIQCKDRFSEHHNSRHKFSACSGNPENVPDIGVSQRRLRNVQAPGRTWSCTLVWVLPDIFCLACEVTVKTYEAI